MSIFLDASKSTGVPPDQVTTLASVPGPEPRSRTSSPRRTAKSTTSSLISLSENMAMRDEPSSYIGMIDSRES